MITLPDASAVQAVFDFKGIFERAIAQVFKTAGFSASQLIDSAVPQDFQAPTPRLEIMVTVGAATKAGFGLVNGIRINATWKGHLTLRAITSASAEGKSTHAQYRAQVCLIGNILGYLVNCQPCGLTNHRINDPVTQNGSSDVFLTKDGFEYSDQTFGFDFSIVNSAWATLAALQATPFSP